MPKEIKELVPLSIRNEIWGVCFKLIFLEYFLCISKVLIPQNPLHSHMGKIFVLCPDRRGQESNPDHRIKEAMSKMDGIMLSLI